MKIWMILTVFLFLLPPVFANEQEIRQAEALIAARQEQAKKNWVKILEIAHHLADWGEKLSCEKAIAMAVPLVMARGSWAGALQISGLYKKINEEEKYRYWFAVYRRLYRDKDRKWKKY